MTTYSELSINAYSRLAASDQPTPGGGSVAAVVGALGAALGQMVYNLTRGKKTYLANTEEVKAEAEGCFRMLASLHQDFIRLVDEDIAAFNLFMEALSLPKGTDKEKAERRKAMEQASATATKVPLETAERALQTLRCLDLLSRCGHKNCISDAGVAALCAHAALQGAAMNVRINLGGIGDEHLRNDLETTCAQYRKESESLIGKIVETVYERM